MAVVRTAVHLRAGEPGAAQAVDDWLRRQGISCTDFADAYEACVYLLENHERVSELAFVGADWLTPDEYAIIRYISATWPGVGVIVYCGTTEIPLCECGPSTRVCTPAALGRLLALTPDQLLHALRQPPAEDLNARKETVRRRGGSSSVKNTRRR